MTDPVAITGIGLITPAGQGTAATWKAVCDGVSTAAHDPQLAGLPADFSCRVPLSSQELGDRVGRTSWRMSRCTELAVLAAREAVSDAGLDPATWDSQRVAVVIGCALGADAVRTEQDRRLRDLGPDMVSPLTIPLILPNTGAGEVAIDLKARGPSLAPATACASGATAITVARDLLLSGQCDIAVAGGAEAALTRLTATGFWRMGALSTRSHAPAKASRPFAPDRDGFVGAEGAGVLVLERAPDAAARGARPRALLAGCGNTTDAHHPTAPDPNARGAEAALRTALAEADLAPHELDHVNAHGTSTELNDAGEAALIARVLPHRPSVTASKGVLGHSCGAAGAVEAVLTTLTIQHHTVPPIANLDAPAPEFDIDCVTKEPRRQQVRTAASHSFGFGGHNAVLVLTSAP
ncbi:3-oxoacyl-ACP synthase [Streptomyces longispororuber]|uniref:3-oxoacyl-ACP synthase n=1 Tax=Streptomyces longispororuber TaxID=68230 RepID=A0A918ZQG5_9ACTN|nr:beta-ketoacyl-[acyl-carrier-protein] synthase family protein [Streptomyces longispororuber]GHE62823.1 3-oxoacyl-ACP synthase [Streptomyces longispororuber]